MSDLTLEPRVPAHIITEVARAVDAVKSIDEIVEWLKRDSVENLAERGDAIRGIFGRNRLSRLTDAVVGEVCRRSLIETLLVERTDITETWSHLVEFPEPPELPSLSFRKGGEA